MSITSKKFLLIAAAITVVLLVITVVLWFAMNNASTPEYETVRVEVLSGGSTYQGSRTTHELQVKYNGKTYDVKNLHSTWEYSIGDKITAYLYNDTMYGNIEGIRTSGPLAMTYFAFLILTIFTVMATGALFMSYRKANKAQQQT